MTGEEANTSDSAGAIALAHLLATAAAGDTLMRDVYLRRGRTLLDPICPEARHRSALEDRVTVDRLLAQSRAAVSRQDWAQVEELAGRAAQLRRLLEGDAPALAVAEEVYGTHPVALDPFSRGVGKFSGVKATSARSDTLAALERLARDDAERRAFYEARRAAIAALTPATSAAPAEAEAQGPGAERRALAAVERGDVAELARLAHAMRARAGGTASHAAAPGAAGRFQAPAVLSQPYPDACVASARALGLEHLEFRAQSAETAARIRSFLEQYAWAASAPTLDRARDGVAELRASIATLPAFEGAKADVLAETVSLFALHLFVNSAGIRYLPMLSEREFVLLETHAEGDETASGLVRALGLERRRAVARDEVEEALLRRGGDVVATLGLDPEGFRVVCVPPDVFMRVGAARGWGTREEWTQFDGYQVRSNGRLLALVGGNARFGGTADLCGISPSDARDNTVTRFAVVRRERLAAGLV